ncbi:Bgt-20963, partial [Blumeria graminis f. sp. tritici]
TLVAMTTPLIKSASGLEWPPNTRSRTVYARRKKHIVAHKPEKQIFEMGLRDVRTYR